VTKVSVVSDIHLEFADCTLPGGDILILAGDIWLARDMGADGSARPEKRKRFVRFCQEELSKYSAVLAITGNHEAYGSNIAEMDATIRDFLAAHAPNVRLLVNQVAMIGGVAFLGTPLWATCGVGNPVAEMAIGGGMNDFRLIRTHVSPLDRTPHMVGRERRFTPRDANALHEHAIVWLADELPRHPRCVVIGHHAPSLISAGGERNDPALDRAYCSSLDTMIEAHPQIAIWIHGHTHRPENYRIGNTQVIANPRGYFPHESVARAFNPNAADFTLESVGA
jgi:Icc-related predicted phosphoesterase